MATNRRKKSPSPSDDEYYDAFEESNGSDINTVHAVASDSLLPPEGTNAELEDWTRRGRDEEGKGDEDNHLTSSQRGEENRPRDTRDSHPTHILTFTEGQNGSEASSSASPADFPSSFVDEFSSCSVTDSPGNDVCLTDSALTAADPSLASTCPALPIDSTSSTVDASLSLTDSIPSDDFDSTSNSSNAGSVSSTPTTPKKVVKKHSTMKWTTAAREVVQGGHSEEGCFRRSSSSSSLSSGSERKISSSNMLEDIAQGNIDNWDAETAVALLRFPTVANYSGLKKLMEMANKDWLEDFLSLDGLGVLFESLERLGERGFSSIADALLQLECVLCIKAVMNSTTGLNYITNDTSYVRKLAKALDSKNMLVKKQVFELLSALCVYSECGHALALDALNNYKVYKKQRYRFQLVVEELKETEVVEYQTTLLAFINCVVLGAGSLPTRTALRNEFIGLDLLGLLDSLRAKNNEVLAVQVAAFEDSYEDDLEQLFGPDAAHHLNHYDAFNSLFVKVRDTPHALQLLGLLINLTQLNPDDQERFSRTPEAMDDELLIELVRNHPVLYDLSQPKYMDSNFKQDIWNKIGEEMKVDGSACKSRWNNIRDNYRKSMKKTSTKSGQSAKKIKLYKFSEQLSFLKLYMHERETKGNIASEEHEGNNHDDVVENQEDEEENIQTDAGEPTVLDGGLHEDLQTQPLPSPKPTLEAKVKSLAGKSKKRVAPQQTASAKLMEYLISKQENQTASTPPHPVDAFLAGIAPTLKTLTPYYLNVAKSEIFATVQKYEMQMLINQQSFERLPEPSASTSSTSTPHPSPQPVQEHTTVTYGDQQQKLSTYTSVPNSANPLQNYFSTFQDS